MKSRRTGWGALCSSTKRVPSHVTKYDIRAIDVVELCGPGCAWAGVQKATNRWVPGPGTAESESRIDPTIAIVNHGFVASRPASYEESLQGWIIPATCLLSKSGGGQCETLAYGLVMRRDKLASDIDQPDVVHKSSMRGKGRRPCSVAVNTSTIWASTLVE